MLNKRIIACLDVRDGKLAKSVKFVDTRDIGDPIALLGELFASGGATPVVSCADALDANGDGAIDIADAVRLLNSLFGLGPIVIPFPGNICGPDGAPDGLDCSISTCP